MEKCFAYTRVSTVKQGEHGVSLQEQRDAILRYAQAKGLEVVSWFEERETAAKAGRPVFTQMLRLLKQGRAEGVIIHKVDRGSRNFKDWGELHDLSERGVTLHVAADNTAMNTNPAWLLGDIQAAIAAHYTRNLRDEVKKGIYGRLKQGLYPLGAPIGYLDRGGGKPKEIDPVRGPLVRLAFDLYATGRYSMLRLLDELAKRGLRTKRGVPVTINGLATLLHNPFYTGIIRLRDRQTFSGVHQPLISRSLFDRVQLLLSGKAVRRVDKHDFLFRKLLACGTCGATLIGETKKGHVYYRCHARTCRGTCVREEAVEQVAVDLIRCIQFTKTEKEFLRQMVEELRTDWANVRTSQIQAGSLRLSELTDRLNRLTDAFLDNVLDRELFEQRKTALLMERKQLDQQLAELQAGTASLPETLQTYLELIDTAEMAYNSAVRDEKRDFLRIVTSNRTVQRKHIVFTPSKPFDEALKRRGDPSSGPMRSIPRTVDALWHGLLDYFQSNPGPHRWQGFRFLNPALKVPDLLPRSKDGRFAAESTAP